MSPDARLIAASNLLAASMLRPWSENSPPYDAERIAEDVLELELTLGDSGKPEPGIRGMVPVAWVKDMLGELFSVAAQIAPQPLPVAEKINSILTQLRQFSEDA